MGLRLTSLKNDRKVEEISKLKDQENGKTFRKHAKSLRIER